MSEPSLALNPPNKVFVKLPSHGRDVKPANGSANQRRKRRIFELGGKGIKALILKERDGPLVPEEVPMPQPGPGEAVVRVRACGLGLTLVWNRKGRGSNGSESSDKLPRIIGHEIAGDVVDCGSGVRNFQTGDRVNVYYYLTCGDCRWCNVGREDLCDNHAGYVGRQIDGVRHSLIIVHLTAPKDRLGIRNTLSRRKFT